MTVQFAYASNLDSSKAFIEDIAAHNSLKGFATKSTSAYNLELKA